MIITSVVALFRWRLMRVIKEVKLVSVCGRLINE
jgi:hypothetical protein